METTRFGLTLVESFCIETNQSIEETVWQCLHVSSKEDYIQKPECLFRPDVGPKVKDSVICVCMWDWEHWMLHSIVLNRNSSPCRCTNTTLVPLWFCIFPKQCSVVSVTEATGLVHPKINIGSSLYSPLCHSKPIWPYISVKHKMRRFTECSSCFL